VLHFKITFETSHTAGQLWASSINFEVASCSSWIPFAIFWSQCLANKSRQKSRCFDWLTVTDTCLPIVHRHDFTKAEKLVKKSVRIEANSICRHQFAKVFADCVCALHTLQLEIANTSVQYAISLCRVKAALEGLISDETKISEGLVNFNFVIWLPGNRTWDTGAARKCPRWFMTNYSWNLETVPNIIQDFAWTFPSHGS